MARPLNTRLKWLRARTPAALEQAVQMLPVRIQIYEIAKDGNRWIIWFVPDEGATKSRDIQSGDID